MCSCSSESGVIYIKWHTQRHRGGWLTEEKLTMGEVSGSFPQCVQDFCLPLRTLCASKTPKDAWHPHCPQNCASVFFFSRSFICLIPQQSQHLRLIGSFCTTKAVIYSPEELRNLAPAARQQEREVVHHVVSISGETLGCHVKTGGKTLLSHSATNYIQ